MSPTLLQLYWYDGKFYLPAIVRTTAGFTMETKPVAELRREQAELRDAIEASIRKGNPVVPTPSRHEMANVPEVVRAARARTMLVFEKRATMWQIHAADRELTLELLKRVPKGGWGEPEKAEVFPNTPVGVERLIGSIFDQSADS
jgi:hypothetical protein